MEKKLTKRQISNLQNKTTIIETSKELFYNNSYEETTMADIAKETGLSNGTIYNLYKNKAAILYDIYEKYVNKPINIMDSLDEKTSDPATFLIKAYIESLESWLNVGWSVSEQCYILFYNNEPVSNDFIEIHIKSEIYKYIQRAQEAGTITNTISAQLIEDILSSQVRGILYNWHLKKGNYDLIVEAEKQLKVFLKFIVGEGK
jgi:AcrR family transcriptional regulator